jgi:hypothetical protein
VEAVKLAVLDAVVGLGLDLITLGRRVSTDFLGLGSDLVEPYPRHPFIVAVVMEPHSREPT